MGKIRREYWIALALVACAGAGVATFRNNESVSDTLRCPSEYATVDSATTAFETFSKNYYASHPYASAGDMLHARLDFYVSHHCTQELQSYRNAEAGEADKATMDMIDRAIQEAHAN